MQHRPHSRILALVLLAWAGMGAAASAASVAIEDFEAELQLYPAVKNGWEAKGDGGSTASIAKNTADPKRGAAAGEIKFDVKPGAWALVQKKLEGADWLSRGPKAISFWLKGDAGTELELELEESYSFKWRKKIPVGEKDWHLVSLKFTDFASDEKSEMSPADLVVLKIISRGGSSKFLIDDIQVECGEQSAPPAAQAPAGASPVAVKPAREVGFVRRVSPNGRYLVHEDGSAFLAIGQNRYNIASGKFLPEGRSLEDYFRNMAAHGQNTLRLWAEGDSDPKRWLETAPGIFNEEQAKRIDEVFDMAARYGVYIILTPWDTWNLVHFPNKAAYFASGQMKSSSDFITQEKVHEMQQRKWKYMIERWASRPNLLAWELLNEIDVFRAKPEEELAWVEKTAAYVRHNDSFNHLITISFSERENEAIWRASEIDFVSVHYYGNNGARGVGDIGFVLDWLLHKKMGGHWRFEKPVLLTEVGLANTGYEPRWVRNMMWASLASGAGGPAMRWTDQGQWGDWSADEYRYSAAIGRFCNFVDWRGLLEQPLSANKIQALAKDARAFGVSSDSTALAWVEGIAQDDRKYSTSLRIDGLSRGTFAAYFFDPESGDLLEKRYLEVKAGSILVQLPAFDEAAVCYLEKISATAAKRASPPPTRRAEAPSGDADGRIKCVQRSGGSKEKGGRFGWDDASSFLVDTSVPEWHTRFNTRVSDGVAPDGDADLSGKIYTAWDENFFYVMARVRDDVVVTDRPAEQAYNMDSLELYFDKSNDKTRRTYRTSLNHQVVIILKTASGGGPQALLSGKPVGTVSVLFKPDGYILRAAIPFDALGFRPDSDRTIGFDIQLNDCDDPHVGRETALAWAGGDNLNWCDPSVFGELEFVDVPRK